MTNAYKVTLLFPEFDNDGKEYGKAVWDWWSDEIRGLTGGFTDLGVVEGWWLGRSDRNKWIVILVRAKKELTAIRAFLRQARLKFQQEAMYLDYHPVYFEEVY